jgi:hypothetical protein
LTVLGVGSTVGSGTIQYTAVDAMSDVNLNASWGFSYGFYLFLVALSVMIGFPLLMKWINGSFTIGNVKS